MYLRMLLKDLKRKKTMNVILLLFVILAATFISSGVSNLTTVTSALDDYFQMSGLQDYFVGTLSDGIHRAEIEPVMENLESMDSYKTENSVMVVKEEQLQLNGHTVNMPMAMLVTAFESRAYEYFGDDNAPLKTVKPGEVYLCAITASAWKAAPGDRLTMKIGNEELELTVGGIYKDVVFGSEYVGSKRLVISQEDFDSLYEAPTVAPLTSCMGYIDTDDVDALQKEVSKLDASYHINFNIPQSLLRSAYTMVILPTVVILVFSVFIVLIALTILRFSIHTSIEEEFREIGVMKAVGLPLSSTRFMYVTKYAALGCAGTVAGFFLGIPFGNMLIQNTADTMVILSSHNLILNLCASAVVFLLILFFSYRCTGKMKKLTPMDAIRSGETGERYGKKGKLSLTKSRLSNPLFMALNDICSQVRRYVVMLIAFSLSLILIVMLANTANTLQSDKIVKMLGVLESHVYISDMLSPEEMLAKDGEVYVQEMVEKTQKNLEEQGIPCRVFTELWVRCNLQKGDVSLSSTCLYGIGTQMEEYTFLEGSGPESPEEIALTGVNAQRLGVSVGDTILCNGKECMVTGIFDCFNNMGDSARLYAGPDHIELSSQGISAIQVLFTDAPDAQKLQEYREKIQSLYPDAGVQTSQEFIREAMGSTGDLVGGLKDMAVAIVILVSILIVVLMERSFISTEKSEIALLKAVGFQNGTLALWHTLRITLVVILAAIISLLVSTPLTRLCIGPVFEMMGTSQIEFVMQPVENFVMYPCMMILFTAAACWLTAQFMKKISPSDTGNID